MLVYHPSLDIYHTAFRILKVLNDNPNVEFEKDRMRIFDFIILFPHELKNIKIPENAERGIKTLFKETNYNKLPDSKIVFNQIRSFYETSLKCLVTRGALDIDSYKNNIIKLNPNFSLNIDVEFSDDKSIETKILNILYTTFLKMPLVDLKERTGLIEYRYDIPQN